MHQNRGKLLHLQTSSSLFVHETHIHHPGRLDFFLKQARTQLSSSSQTFIRDSRTERSPERCAPWYHHLQLVLSPPPACASLGNSITNTSHPPTPNNAHTSKIHIFFMRKLHES